MTVSGPRVMLPRRPSTQQVRGMAISKAVIQTPTAALATVTACLCRYKDAAPGKPIERRCTFMELVRPTAPSPLPVGTLPWDTGHQPLRSTF